MILGINCLPLHLEKAFFSIMQNKTDKGALLVSKSLPVVNSNAASRLFSARSHICYVLNNGRLSSSLYQPRQPIVSEGDAS